MATVKNVRLWIIFGSGAAVRARIEYDIDFAPKEIAHNIVFWEVAAVIEQQVKMDEWIMRAPYLKHLPPENDKRDDLVQYIYQWAVAPDGNASLHRTWERSIAGPWEEGGPQYSRERLRPLVYVTPLEITSHLVIGAEVSVDV